MLRAAVMLGLLTAFAAGPAAARDKDFGALLVAGGGPQYSTVNDGSTTRRSTGGWLLGLHVQFPQPIEVGLEIRCDAVAGWLPPTDEDPVDSWRGWRQAYLTLEPHVRARLVDTAVFDLALYLSPPLHLGHVWAGSDEVLAASGERGDSQEWREHPHLSLWHHGFTAGIDPEFTIAGRVVVGLRVRTRVLTELGARLGTDGAADFFLSVFVVAGVRL